MSHPCSHGVPCELQCDDCYRVLTAEVTRLREALEQMLAACCRTTPEKYGGEDADCSICSIARAALGRTTP